MNQQQALTYSVLFAGTTAATATMAGTLDCQDAMYATIVVTVSAEANTNSTGVVVALQGDDTSVVTNMSTTGFDDHQRTIDNTAAAVGTFHVDMRGRERYLRILLTPDTVASNGAVIASAVGILQTQSEGALAATATAE